MQMRPSHSAAPGTTAGATLAGRVSAWSEAQMNALQVALDDAQVLAVAEIQGQTLSGVDADGRPFAPYSPGYARRKARGRGAGRVNLYGEGDMFGAMDTRREDDYTRVVYVRPGKEAVKAAAHHYGRGRVPARRWFGLSPERVQKLTNLITEALRKVGASASVKTYTTTIKL